MGRIDDSQIAALLALVQKPGRYSGGELNAVIRETAALRMAISYPDLYEIGMSNNGISILYDIANSIEGVACERVFAVEKDFEDALCRAAVPLYTLETRVPLHELDIVGFNIAHELLYTNVLQILELGRIPLMSADRDENQPFIIGGGSAVSNPAPFGRFLDACFLGDGEDGLIEIVRSIMDSRNRKLARKEALSRLEEIEGVYVPSLHPSRYVNGVLAEVAGRTVKKRTFRGMAPVVPSRPVVPSIRTAQDRAIIEVSRGCGNLCRFCHAGYYELPFRNYRPRPVADKIFEILDNTGYSELTLSSLSLGDYRYLEDLLGEIMPELNRRGVSVSFPSLRVDPSTLPLVEIVSDVRRSSLTFAVESASDELRAIANKRLSNEDLLGIVEHVFERGWKVIKLYFMIGLPGYERFNEAADIAALIKKLAFSGRTKREINVTVSPFIPKPHTPFQYARQADLDYLEATVTAIKKAVPRSVKVRNHNLRSSRIEGLLSRGGEKLGDVILRVFSGGGRLDSWGEHFDAGLWERVLDEIMPDWKGIFDPVKEGAVIPWAKIETGYERLVDQQRRKCTASPLPGNAMQGLSATKLEEIRNSFRDFTVKYEVRRRMRLAIAKKKEARYIPHIDFLEIIKRALRMSSVPVSFTQGFNKRERISMGYPLPLGVESECELCDIDLYAETDPGDAMARMNRHFPAGILVSDARVHGGRESIMGVTRAFEFRVTTEVGEARERLHDGISGKPSLLKESRAGSSEIPFEKAIIEIEAIGDGMRIIIPAGDENAMRIDRIVSGITGIPLADMHAFLMLKTRQFMKEGNALVVMR